MRADKQIKAVIFDLDDTLISWEKIEIPSWQAFNDPKFAAVHAYLADEGHVLPEVEAFTDVMHEQNRMAWQTARETWEGSSLLEVLQRGVAQCGVALTAVDWDDVLRVFKWQPIPGVQPFPDVYDVLDGIRTRGYKIGLVTNSYQPMWMRDIELEKFGLMPYLDARITSGDTGFIKPHPAIYWRMLGLLDLTPTEAVFVGDRPQNDILGANKVGMTSVLMAPPYLDYPLDGITPDYTISTLTELLPVLEALD